MSEESNLPLLQSPESATAQLKALGRQVRGLRERRQLTQEQFARSASISVSFVSLLERGERSPSYETLLTIARALQVPVAQLLDQSVGLNDSEPHRKLLQFVEQAHLNRAQIERFIAVGKAMFDLGLDAAAATCRAQDCDRKVLARGLCASHYHRARRGDLSI